MTHNKLFNKQTALITLLMTGNGLWLVAVLLACSWLVSENSAVLPARPYSSGPMKHPRANSLIGATINPQPGETLGILRPLLGGVNVDNETPIRPSSLDISNWASL